MIEYLEHIDRQLFLFLNSFHSELGDQIMWFISGKLEWIPLYILLLYLVIKKYKKQSIYIIAGIGLTILLSDQVSVKLFKEVFERYRPCQNLELKEIVQLVNNKCGGLYGFVSSHAANSFAMAVFIGSFLKRYYSYSLAILLVWASIVAFSRVYLGVHYPSDILAGALLGTGLAVLVYRVVNNILKLKPQ